VNTFWTDSKNDSKSSSEIENWVVYCVLELWFVASTFSSETGSRQIARVLNGIKIHSWTDFPSTGRFAPHFQASTFWISILWKFPSFNKLNFNISSINITLNVFKSLWIHCAHFYEINNSLTENYTQYFNFFPFESFKFSCLQRFVNIYQPP
jgi:hypothetical protein